MRLRLHVLVVNSAVDSSGAFKSFALPVLRQPGEGHIVSDARFLLFVGNGGHECCMVVGCRWVREGLV
jgi:hypothetical protein